MATDCETLEEPVVTLPKLTDVGFILTILPDEPASGPTAAHPAVNIAMRITAKIQANFQ